MNDFRRPLYERYVSDFKGVGPQTHGRWNEWARYKYLPLLDGLDASSAILELGCGDGRLMEYLQVRGFSNVRGIDISAEQIHLAQQRGCSADMADAVPYLMEHSAQFDAIVALDFVEHFHKDELLTLTSAVLRALKPGGRLVLQTPNGSGLLSGQVVYGDMTHLTIFTPQSLRQLLQGAGFDQFRVYETGPVPVGLKGRVRTLLWRGIKGLADVVRRIETGKSHAIWTENMIIYCERAR